MPAHHGQGAFLSTSRIRARRPRGRIDDHVIATISNVSFSIGLAMSTVSVPLIAVAAGFRAGDVGVLAAVTAICQMLTRFGLGPLMARAADRTLVVLAGCSLASGTAALSIGVSWVTLITCSALQGSALALFWTGSQTHAVRGDRPATSSLALLNFAAGVGQVLGALLGGALLITSHLAALMAAAAFGAATATVAVFLDSLPLLPRTGARKRRAKPGGSRPGRRTLARLAWANATPGGWRALVNSYVPVVLAAGGLSASTIGGLVALANGTSIVGSLLAGRVRIERGTRTLTAGVLASGLGLAGGTLSSHHTAIAAFMLAMSGLGAGLVQTLAPAAANAMAPRDDQGTVILMAGTRRSVANLVAPLIVVAAAPAIGVLTAVAVVAAGTAIPAWLLRGIDGRDPARAEEHQRTPGRRP